jgi:hypothetical protein
MTRHALRGTTVAVIVLASLFAGPAAHASSEPRFNPPFSYLLGAFPLADPLIMALNEAMAGAARHERAQYADIFATFNLQGDPAAETARTCALTLLCTEGDIHLSDAGYQAMADVVFDASDYARLGAGGTE